MDNTVSEDLDLRDVHDCMVEHFRYVAAYRYLNSLYRVPHILLKSSSCIQAFPMRGSLGFGGPLV